MRLLIRLTLVVALLLFTAPLAAGAQAGKIRRIGFLTPGVVEAGNPSIVAFQQRLRELGYIEGQNVALEFRSANGRVEWYPGIAAELVRLKVDVIVAVTNRAIEAAQKATTSIPIVMNQATDPVATGLVASLARPGGNITGLTIQTPDLAGKGLQLLKEAVPTLSRVAVSSTPWASKRYRIRAGRCPSFSSVLLHRHLDATTMMRSVTSTPTPVIVFGGDSFTSSTDSPSPT